MRPRVLLLLSLLVSDLTPPGDGDWVVDDFSWTLCRKQILGGLMAHESLKILLTQTEYGCMCFKRGYVYAALQHKQRSCSFYWPHTVQSDHGHTLSFQDLTRILQRNHIPVLAVPLCYGEEKLLPTFLMNSNPALLLISDTPPTKAGGKTSHIVLNIIKDSPDSTCALLVHHHSTASGQNLQAFLPEKSVGWAPAIAAQLQKMLTTRFCVATTVIASCCPKVSKITSEMNIRKTSEEEVEPPQIKRKGSTQTAIDIKALMQYNGRGSLRASVSQRDIFHAASLHSGPSSVKISHMSQSETQRRAAILVKKKEQLNLNEDSTWQKGFQKQLSLKVASGVNDGGFDVTRQPLMISRGHRGSINRPLSKIRPAQGDNNELFSGKMITKQAELRHSERDSKAEQNTDTMENENQKRFAYILQTHSTHKTDIQDVNEKQVLTDVGEGALIMFFLPEAETQTELRSERKLIPNTDIRRKVMGDPPPITKALKDFTTERYNSKCKCLKGSQCLLEIYIIGRTESLDIKAGERKETMEEQVKETTEKTEHSQTTHIHDEITGINHTKAEENLKTEETAIPSPPPLRMITTEHIADTTTAKVKIKDTTISTEVISQSSPEKDDGQPSAEERPTTGMSPEPEVDTEPGFIKNKTETTQAVTEKPFSGLRMREDVLENITRLLKGTQSEEGALISGTETERKEDQNDPVKSFTFSTHLEAIHKEPTTDKHPKTSGDAVPLCRGLIHRTEAGWKHCIERLRGTESKMFSSRDPMDAGELQKESIREDDNSRLNDEENDHFYYFDGVLKRVQNHFYPRYKRVRHNDVPTERQKRDTHENFLSYIRRLTLRNRLQKIRC